jgi:hypothetical protein
MIQSVMEKFFEDDGRKSGAENVCKVSFVS